MPRLILSDADLQIALETLEKRAAEHVLQVGIDYFEEFD
jgi:hypothetical protein